MEHRLDSRQPYRAEVVLHQQGSPPLPCRARDASVHGMFLEIGERAAELRCRDAVVLELAGGSVRVSAFLVRRHEGGVGVIFASHDPLGLLGEGIGARA